MNELLKEFGKAELSVCCVGLEDSVERRKFEKEAIANTKVQGLMCLNRGGFPVDSRMKRYKLQSEERMLARDLELVRAKLKLLPHVD